MLQRLRFPLFSFCYAVFLLLSAAGIVSLRGTASTAPGTGQSQMPEPAKVGDTITDYFGIKVADPYRWMEAGTDSAEFMSFIKRQDSYTRNQLDAIGTPRTKLLARIAELDNAATVV